MGDVAADAVAPFDGPDPVRPPSAVGQHLGTAVPVGCEPALSQNGLVAGHHLDRHRPLVRVHADHNALCLFHCMPPMLDPLLVLEPGGQRYFELSKPLLSLSLLLVAMPELRRP